MATPNRELILDNIMTTLQTITTGNGYKTTVATVERVFKDAQTAQETGAFPYLGFKPGRQTVQYLPFGDMRMTFPFDIVGHIFAASDEARAEKISALMDDVIAALHVDPSRGGAAVLTQLKEDDGDDGDPDTYDISNDTGTFIMRWECIYYRDTEST